MSNLQSVTDATFEEAVMRSDVPVLVDFWADWCGPCKAMMPTLEEVAETYAGELKVVKLNVTDNEASMARFGARSIPLFVLFTKGAEAARAVGSMSKTRLCAFIDDNV